MVVSIDGVAPRSISGNVPTEPGQILEFARRVGFVRVTNYGELFDVVTEPDPINHLQGCYIDMGAIRSLASSERNSRPLVPAEVT